MQQDPFLAPQDFIKEHIEFLSTNPLGSGGTGIIYYCKHKESDQEYALKQAYQNTFSLLAFQNECNILKQIFFLHNQVDNPSHTFPNYIPYMEKYTQQGSLLMEYIPNESLYNQVSFSGRFREDYVIEIAGELFKRLDHLHQLNVFHLDFKLDNILLDRHFNFKICDFGFANNPIGCTIGYAPYEQKSQQISNYQQYQLCDVFALGIVLFILVMGIPPFQNYDDSWFKLIINEEWNIFWSRIHTYCNETPSKSFQILFQKMVKFNPKTRITMQEIAHQDWFQQPRVPNNQLKQELGDRFIKRKQRQYFQM